MSAAHEIRTIEEFRGATAQPVGVVVVMDTPTSSTRHPTNCQHVTEDNFTTKVIARENKNGRYFFFLRYEDAAEETGADSCGSCG